MADGLVITGTVGAGKTSTLYQACELLVRAEVPHCALDVDALWSGFPGWCDTEMSLRNVRAVWLNFRSVGAEKLLLADVVETPEHAERFKVVCELDRIEVCRLRVDKEEVARRLGNRDSGPRLDRHLARAVELDALLEQADIGDFVVDANGKDHLAVAREVLAAVGWL
ncbi:MAG TPA: hypothetical protein VMY88_05850 [Acidimicrobiales bacterium]|nr:hypothetical protein [Acidimicrobiales bacterium]